MPFGSRIEVEVAGGRLTVGVAGAPEGPAVLLLHGISSSHMAFARVVRELLALRPDVRVLAPDARGRGRSNHVGGPYGVARNGADALAVLDAAGVRSAVVAGHSMGAWVAARLAVEHPGRVGAAVLVDGGVAWPPLDGVTPEEVLGPSIERLRRTFASADEYVDFWRAHPAYSGDRFSPEAEAAARYDLEGRPPQLRARPREDAVRADFRDILAGEATRTAEERVERPLWLVRAGKGMLDEPGGFLRADVVDAFRARHPEAPVVELPSANHYTVTFGPEAAAVAGAIAEALG